MFSAIILARAIIILLLILGNKAKKDREKISPYECGFDPFGGSRIPFSFRFYLLRILFVIFDVEIVLLLPFINSQPRPIINFIILFLFLIILLVGLLHEWREGTLEWKYATCFSYCWYKSLTFNWVCGGNTYSIWVCICQP